MRRKPSRLSTGRLPLLRLFSTLLAATKLNYTAASKLDLNGRKRSDRGIPCV
jgi:hypothetical protein